MTAPVLPGDDLPDAPATALPTRVLVCGGRDFADAAFVAQVLNRIRARRRVVALIEGGAPGADTLAREWALRHGVRICTFLADWGTHGRAAGPIRNAAMLAEGRPDGVVAFPRASGLMGHGTADMVRRAREAGVPVWDLTGERLP